MHPQTSSSLFEVMVKEDTPPKTSPGSSNIRESARETLARRLFMNKIPRFFHSIEQYNLCEAIIINYTLTEQRGRTSIFGTYTWLLCAAGFAVCLISRPNVCSEALRQSLRLCAETLIPSIFPFLIVNSLISCAGGIELAARILGKPFSLLFGVSGNLCAPFLIGLLSGFPSGGAAVASVYERGGCTKSEAERALAFCSNTGPAFAVAGIGGMLGGIRYGTVIYTVQIVCALLVSFILPGRGASEFAMLPMPEQERRGIFVNAVRGAVIPMLNICAFVLAFSPVVALVREALASVGASALVTAGILSSLELTNACAFITSFLPRSLALPFCALAVCWSGFCVHAQTKAEIVDAGLSIKYCILGKLFMGLSAFVITWFAGGFFI